MISNDSKRVILAVFLVITPSKGSVGSLRRILCLPAPFLDEDAKTESQMKTRAQDRKQTYRQIVRQTSKHTDRTMHKKMG